MSLEENFVYVSDWSHKGYKAWQIKYSQRRQCPIPLVFPWSSSEMLRALDLGRLFAGHTKPQGAERI